MDNSLVRIWLLELVKLLYKNINREDFGKIKNENLQLKLDLGLRDKQITALNSKISEIKELEEKKNKKWII